MTKRTAIFTILATLSCVSSHAQGIRLSDEQAAAIARKIYVNECGGKAEFLTHWNSGEEFASLGIGHFIWYPENRKGPFEESFPKLLAFMARNGVKLPGWLAKTPTCPWDSRARFYKDIKSGRMTELRRFLADTMPWQARFAANRLEEALPKILKNLSPGDREPVRRQFYRVAGDPGGLYALMDYVNFKGEGVSPGERYQGQGWGLLQVLEEMSGTEAGEPARNEFAQSAEKVLTRRVKNSPPERNEARWLPVWIRRVQTYRAETNSGAAERMLRALSLEEKVGQLFLIAIDTEIAARYESEIRAGHLGGAMLRWDKFTGPEAKAFIARMQEWTASSPGRPGLLFAADHEGGALFTQRLYGGTIFPGNMALGAAGDPSLSESAATATARELKSLGIAVDFAPDVDVNADPDNPIIGVRSFGEDPEAVSRLGAAAVKGYLRGGIAPAAKHFPGHGGTSVDSHQDLPVISKSLRDLARVDLPPFRAAIRAKTPLVMSAHILVPALDPSEPVPLSSAAVEGLLRRDMRFDGVVVSDSLDMGAIVKKRRVDDAAELALRSGCDLLLIGKAPLPDAYLGVLAAVLKGRISRQRLDESVLRILGLKERLGLLGRAGPSASIRIDEARAHRRLARRIAERSVTLLRCDRRLLPLKRLGAGKSILLVVASPKRYENEVRGWFDTVRSRHARAELLEVSYQPDSQSIQQAVEKAQAADIVVFGTYQFGTTVFTQQQELYRRLRESKKPLILASLMNPYDLRYYPDAQTVLCTYGLTSAALEAATRVLFGEIPPRGRLPVTVPGLYKRGSGLSSLRAG